MNENTRWKKEKIDEIGFEMCEYKFGLKLELQKTNKRKYVDLLKVSTFVEIKGFKFK